VFAFDDDCLPGRSTTHFGGSTSVPRSLRGSTQWMMSWNVSLSMIRGNGRISARWSVGCWTSLWRMRRLRATNADLRNSGRKAAENP